MLPSSTGSIMAVKLEKQTKHDSVKVISKSQPQKKAKAKNEHIVKKAAIATTALKNKTQKNIKEATEKLQTNEQQTVSRARIISIIYSELNQHFTYPKLAVRRNWQGKVLLSLRVSSSGNIENIQLKKSSGYNVLDQAAINALHKMKNLPHISSWLSSDIELQLPITYNLIEG